MCCRGGIQAEYRAALEGERANVALARQCVQKLGGVPSMLPLFDSTKIPEEKVRQDAEVMRRGVVQEDDRSIGGSS